MSKCTEILTITCENPECGAEFEILKKTYNNRKYGKIPMYCKDCMKKYRNACQSETLREMYQNRTPEQKATISEKLSKAAYKRYENPEEHEKSSKAAYKRYENPEEHEKTSSAVKLGQANMSEEDKQRMRENQVKGIIETWDNRGAEERKLHGEKVKAGHDRMTPEQKLRTSMNIRNAQIERFRKLSFDDKLQFDLNIALKTNELCGLPPLKFDSPIEKDFYWYMMNKNIDIGYHFYNTTIHPEFYNIFKDNPYSKYNYSSPFHEWDFKIFTYKTPILVDIDGGFHDPSRNKYNLPNMYKTEDNELITMNCYYDLRRPYQTDGYPAYAVLCYEGFFDGFNKVIDINNSNKPMNFMDFLQIIAEYMDPKYLDKE